MIDADTVEAVWNQAHGVVQLFVNDALLMAMPQAQAREMANALLSAARVPDLARAMLDDKAVPIPIRFVSPGTDTDNGNPQPYPLSVPAKHEIFLTELKPSVIPGTDADSGLLRWSPDTSRDAVLREQYARG